MLARLALVAWFWSWFAAWSRFGFRLILFRACLLAFGWFLNVRTSVLVLDGMDSMLVDMLGLLGLLDSWFGLGGEGCLYIRGRSLYIGFLLTQQFTSLLDFTVSSLLDLTLDVQRTLYRWTLSIEPVLTIYKSQPQLVLPCSLSPFSHIRLARPRSSQ
jgi:hypothetical protein